MMDRSGGTTIKSQPDADATKVQMMPVCTSLLVTLIYLHRIEKPFIENLRRGDIGASLFTY